MPGGAASSKIRTQYDMRGKDAPDPRCYSENGLQIALPVLKFVAAILCAFVVMAFADNIPDLPGVLDQKCSPSAITGSSHQGDRGGLRKQFGTFCRPSNPSLALSQPLSVLRPVNKLLFTSVRVIPRCTSDPSPPVPNSAA